MYVFLRGFVSFFFWVFTNIYASRDSSGRGKQFLLTPLYHFYQLHTHLDIRRVIAAQSSPLHIASGGNRTRVP